MILNSNDNFQLYISQLKEGNRDLFGLIDTPEKNFEVASFEELLSNSDDVLSGVNKVLKNFRNVYFGIFNGCLVKYHDDGDIKFVFFTETVDTDKIVEMATVLLNEFGHGYFKSEDSFPFSQLNRVHDIASGCFDNTFLDLVTVWHCDDLSLLLQYRVSPLWQFSLMVTKSLKKAIDKSIRRNGTILDIVNLNIHHLLNQKALTENPEFQEGAIKFIDYTFHLENKELDVFDTVVIRIFSDKRTFDLDTQIHVTLLSQTPLNYKDKVRVAESLIKIYGADNIGAGELQINDFENLEDNKWWLGRRWLFNQFHGLWNSDNKEEKCSYEVSIDNMDNESEGFKINILSYNQLVDLFDSN